MFLSGLVSLTGWITCRGAFSKVASLPGRRSTHSNIQWVPLCCLAVILLVLLFFSASNVRNDGRYIALFLILGTAWLYVATIAFSGLGISFPVDVLGQNNAAAGISASGGLAGVTIVYAGAQIGEGSTIWTTIIPAFIGTCALFFCWLMLEVFSKISEAITLDQDRASGWRLAGYLTACGLFFGRAGAGDWHGLAATLSDFIKYGWPTVFLLGAALWIERKMQPTRQQPFPPVTACGLVPGGLYLTFATLGVLASLLWSRP